MPKAAMLFLFITRPQWAFGLLKAATCTTLPFTTPNTTTAVVMTPLTVRKAALHSTRQLLSRMQLAGYASAILHPLLRVLDGPAEDLRKETLDTVLSLSVALGSDFVIFIPTIRKAR